MRCEQDSTSTAGFASEGRAMSQGVCTGLGARKGKEMNAPLERPDTTLILAQRDPGQTSDPQH